MRTQPSLPRSFRKACWLFRCSSGPSMRPLKAERGGNATLYSHFVMWGVLQQPANRRPAVNTSAMHCFIVCSFNMRFPLNYDYPTSPRLIEGRRSSLQTLSCLEIMHFRTTPSTPEMPTSYCRTAIGARSKQLLLLLLLLFILLF